VNFSGSTVYCKEIERERMVCILDKYKKRIEQKNVIGRFYHKNPPRRKLVRDTKQEGFRKYVRKTRKGQQKDTVRIMEGTFKDIGDTLERHGKDNERTLEEL